MKRTLTVFICLFIWCCSSKPVNEIKKDSVEVEIDTSAVNDSGENNQAVAPNQVYGEIQIMQCVFKSVTISGACVHIEFSCGDFGLANVGQLGANDLELWRKLTIINDVGEVVANPAYLGQKFTIAHNLIRKLTCEGSSQTMEVPNLVAFRMN